MTVGDFIMMLTPSGVFLFALACSLPFSEFTSTRRHSSTGTKADE
jgi:hypothetical protein